MIRMKNAKSRTETKRREKTFIHLLSLTSNAQPSPWSPARGFYKSPPPSPPSFSAFIPTRTSLPAWFLEGSVGVSSPAISSLSLSLLTPRETAVLHRFLSFVFGFFLPLRLAPSHLTLSVPFSFFALLSYHHSDTQHSAFSVLPEAEPHPRLCLHASPN